MLNINEVDVESVSTISQSNETLKVKVRLKADPDVVCPLYKGPVIKNSFVSRKLTHSTLVNRKCFIIYERRRYICKDCNFSFSEHNPFINTSESATLETKINVLKVFEKS